MKIWALTDSRIGNNKQTLALAAAIGTFEEKRVEFTKIADLPNKILGNSLLGVKADFGTTCPDLIISAGRKLARVSNILKKKYKCKNIHIMHPGNKLIKKFDYVIIPNHDKVDDAENIIKITGSVCAKPKVKFEQHTTQQIAVLLGYISATEAKKLVEIINANSGLYLITTSRRTEDDAVKVLEKEINQLHKLYKFGSAAPNPYNDYLRDADIIIASGDSANMLTEAAHTAKPVYILEVETKDKFKRLWAELYSLGIARKLENKLESWEYKPLDNIAEITKSIK